MKSEPPTFFRHHPPYHFYGFIEKYGKLYSSLSSCSFPQVVTSLRNLLTFPELFCCLVWEVMSLHFTHGFCSPWYLHASFRLLCFDPGQKVIIYCAHWQIWLSFTFSLKLVNVANTRAEDLQPVWQATGPPALSKARGNRRKIPCRSWLVTEMRAVILSLLSFLC